MRKARWLADWRNSDEKPVFYHCISRVVERRHAFGPEDKEKFRALMRIQEVFTGCRVVAYCLMCNHIHLLLEVPPCPATGFTDKELLRRLAAIYSEAFVAEVAKELATAKKAGSPELAEAARQAIHARFTPRMHDLGQFMKGLMQRFTQWFNGAHARTGALWEGRFKSVIVEDGTAARTMAAYIDLNPVRAGIVDDPAKYRWSSYGEAIGGGSKGHGLTARAGLVRAWAAHQGITADATLWPGDISRHYRKLLLGGSIEKTVATVTAVGKPAVKKLRKGITAEKAARELSHDGEIPLGAILRRRVRYFTDGAIIGDRAFVNEAFTRSRSRFGSRRKDGARKLKGNAAPTTGILWTIRDLRKDIA